MSAAPVTVESSPSRTSIVVDRVVTSLFVIGPAVALGIAIPLLWGHAVSLHDIVIALALYLVTGFGITVGYHRLCTHRTGTARAPEPGSEGCCTRTWDGCSRRTTRRRPGSSRTSCVTATWPR
jgi:hypothetical protein